MSKQPLSCFIIVIFFALININTMGSSPEYYSMKDWILAHKQNHIYDPNKNVLVGDLIKNRAFIYSKNESISELIVKTSHKDKEVRVVIMRSSNRIKPFIDLVVTYKNCPSINLLSGDIVLICDPQAPDS